MTITSAGPAGHVVTTITAGPSGRDGESLNATSTVIDKVLDISEALVANSSVQDGVLVSNSPGRQILQTSVQDGVLGNVQLALMM